MKATVCLSAWVVLGFSLPAPVSMAAPCPPWLDSAERVVFLGDSITYSGQYVADLEAYVRTRYRKCPAEFLNLGLPSETVSGLSEPGHAGGRFPRPNLHERLERLLEQTQPDLVFACYGMNDGIYHPFSEERFAAYRRGIERLVSRVQQFGARIILITPTVFDPQPIRDRTLPAGEKEYRRPFEGYDEVLARYSQWLCEQRHRGWRVLDVHTPMRRFLEAQRRRDPEFTLARDGVHINDLGHWLVAREVLRQLGEPARVARYTNALEMLGKLGDKAGEALALIRKRQRLMCDAWLTAIGHKRPGMKRGLPVAKAQAEAGRLDAQLAKLLGLESVPAKPGHLPGMQGYYRFPAVNGRTVVFTAEGDLWKVDINGGVAQRLTTHPGTEAYPAISPDGKTLAFSAEYEGPTEVYTMPLEGGLPRRHTYEGSAYVVGWTPQGEILYTTRNFSTLPDYQLVRLNPRDDRRTVLPLSQANEGVFDASGRTLFFTRLPFQGSSTKRYQGGSVQNLWRFDQDGPEAAPLTTDYPGTSKNPMWWQGRLYFLSDRDGIMNLWSMKTDGTDLRQHTFHHRLDVQRASLSQGHIVYQHGADLRVYDIQRKRDRRIPIALASDFDQTRERWVRNPFEYLTSAHLSARGDRVALTARGQVFVAPVKPGRLVTLPRREGVRYRYAQFLPDGRVLVLSDETGELEFWTLPANGVGEPKQITDNGTVFRYKAVPSPNGQWLAWYDKNQELWLWHFAKSRAKRIDRSLRGNFHDLAWSPDSRWLAYVKAATNGYDQIHLYGVEDERRLTLTSDRTDSYSPAWSPDGKWLYFLSDRALRSLVSSPWGPRQPEPFFTETTKIYHVALVKRLRSPFRRPDELQQASKTNDKKSPASASAHLASDQGAAQSLDKPAGLRKAGERPIKPATPAPTKTESRPSPKPLKVEIDEEGLSERVEPVPVSPGNYEDLVVTAKRLIWTERPTGFNTSRRIRVLDITSENPTSRVLAEGVESWELSMDRQKLLLRRGNTFNVINADSPAPARLDSSQVPLGGWSFSFQPREEWRQIFTEAWRMLRDYFYDRHLHGVDWPSVLQKYLPLVDRVAERGELSDVIAQMAGELSALHIFVRYGDQRDGPDQIQPGFLGARLERADSAGGWRIEHIYRTDPDYPEERSPLARPGIEVQEGEVITRINGHSTLEVAHPNQLLRNQAGRQVLLEVLNPKSGKRRFVIVEPITASAEAELRYDEWEYTRRLRVEELGGGRIGYVHLRAMGAGDMAQWARDYYPVFDRQGLIIDVRHNRGGNIDSWILSRLLRKAWFFWQPRVGIPYWNMQYAFRGHMVVLCDSRTASDGEAFTEGFRRLGLGKVIGTRTWGGEVWLSAQRWLVDRGMATAAETGVYGPEGEWLIEGHGVDPDLVVDNLPHETFKGKDAQLEAAVRHLLELIRKDPRPVPPHPPYPNKAFTPSK